MNLSLEIIKEQWTQQFEAAFLPLSSNNRHIFYSSVRFLSDDITTLLKDTIYVIPTWGLYQKRTEKSTISRLTIEPGAGIIYTLPDADPHLLYERYHIVDEGNTEICLVQGNDALVTFNRLLSIYEFYDEYNKLLMEALNGDDALQGVINLICEIVGNPAYVVDHNYRALAMDQGKDLPHFSIYWKRIRENGFLPYNIVSSILSNPEWNILQDTDRPMIMQTREFASRFIACNVWMNHRIQWRLFITESMKGIQPADLDLTELMVEYLKHALLSDLKYRIQGEGSHELFLREAAAGTILSSQFLAEQLEPLNWKLEDRYCLLEIHTPEFDGYLRRYIAQTLQDELDCRSFTYEDRFFLIIKLGAWSQDTPSYDRISASIHETLSSYSCEAVLSNDFFGFHFLPVYVAQTEELLELLLTSQEKESYTDYRKSFTRLLAKVLHQKELSWTNGGRQNTSPYLVARSKEGPGSLKPGFLHALSQYDMDHKSELYVTLHAFISHDRNLVQTARALHIHRNTLVYRLDQIKQIIGEDLDDPKTRLLTWIALEFL